MNQIHVPEDEDSESFFLHPKTKQLAAALIQRASRLMTELHAACRVSSDPAVRSAYESWAHTRAFAFALSRRGKHHDD